MFVCLKVRPVKLVNSYYMNEKLRVFGILRFFFILFFQVVTMLYVSCAFVLVMFYLCEGETSDGLKVQSHVSIGANDLLIVGAGVLGRLVAEKWREVYTF